MIDKINTTIRIDRINKQNKILPGKEYKANSWVVAFLKGIMANFTAANETQVDTGNISRNLSNTGYFIVNIGAGVDIQGIVVGTGNTAVTVDDYALETKIAHGVGAGQLSYQAVSADADCANSPAGTWFVNINRTFINNSGDSILIKEVGIYAKSTNYYCIERTVLDTPYTVLNGEGCVVNYKIAITV